MAAISFTYNRNKKHPTLSIDTGVNQIVWSYNLNTQAFPTYGGEVLQVLSTNIDVMTIQGDIRSYRKMEEIYSWFLFYMQDATQGVDTDPGYSEEAVVMKYPERGWTIGIQPIALPGMRYGTEVVVPTWQLQAHVLDPDPDMTELTMKNSLDGKDTGFATFQDLSMEIGYHPNDVFSDPLGIANSSFEKKLQKTAHIDPAKQLQDIAAKLNQTLNSFLQQDYGDALKPYEDAGVTASGPASPTNSDHKDSKDSSKKSDSKKHGK